MVGPESNMGHPADRGLPSHCPWEEGHCAVVSDGGRKHCYARTYVHQLVAENIRHTCHWYSWLDRCCTAILNCLFVINDMTNPIVLRENRRVCIPSLSISKISGGFWNNKNMFAQMSYWVVAHFATTKLDILSFLSNQPLQQPCGQVFLQVCVVVLAFIALTLLCRDLGDKCNLDLFGWTIILTCAWCWYCKKRG